MVLTLPMVVYVDDTGLIGDDPSATDREMDGFHDWSEVVCGIPWKRLKDRRAAIPQYYIGFWWNSINLARCLDERKLAKYLKVLLQASEAVTLTLNERQSLAGKMQTICHGTGRTSFCLLCLSRIF